MAETSDGLPPDLIGQTIGEYQILRKLGQGAMGQVFLARQQSLKREVALKILRRDHAENPTALKRFQAEAEAVARVTHANIVQVYAVGEHAGLRYMALEFVDGRNLRDYLARKGSPELPLALGILRQVAAALQRASEIGLVHRDIKPENILITRKAEVKVADFGLSRYFAGEGQPLNLTQSGMTLGTPLYMSPEQVQGKAVDHRSDLYSFGVTAYHLLAGQPPFTGVTPFDVALQHVQSAPPSLAALRPDLPPALCDLVHKLMAKRPEDRYQTARDVIRDLAKVQKGLPLGAPNAPAGAASLAGLAANPAPPQLGLSGTALSAPALPSAPPRRWLPRLLGVLALASFAAGGWWLAGLAPSPSDAGATPGLPDARPPGRVVTARERDLTARMKSREVKPAEYVELSLELGLLLIRERRFDEADKVFKEIEQDRIRPIDKAQQTLITRLGQAIVLAHRDKAHPSNEAFAAALAGPSRVLQQTLLDEFLFKHPDFGQAVAEALDRNAENLGPGKSPASLEWLRTPAGRLRGPKP